MKPVLQRCAAAKTIAILIGLAATMLSPVARANHDGVVRVNQDGGASLALTRPLSSADEALYREIFSVQENGDWKRADRLIAELSDRLLLGHVLAQRYLHPTKYRSKYKELKDWMAEYADHPQANRIYKLALRRRPANWNYPEKPDMPSTRSVVYDRIEPLPAKSLSSSNRRKANQYRRTIKRYLARGATLAAKRLLQSADVRNLLSDAQYDDLAGRQGFRYFIDERDDWALEWAGTAAKRSGALVPDAHWAAGLAAYRLGKVAEAAEYFEVVALSNRSSGGFKAAGGFWAARSYLRARQPAKVVPMLMIAAEYDRTFYGLLARHILGHDMMFQWNDPPAHQHAVETVSAIPRGRRALALIHVGQTREAERELRYLALQTREDDLDAALGVLAIANHANLPQLAIRLDETVLPDTGFHGAAYPLPAWRPEGGFTIDPALVYALIRQESRFNPEAKSWAGARGLMQLMPRTASFVTNDRKYHRSRTPYLYNPTLNMTIGQRYIEILRDDQRINGSLVAMLAAWNGGPGNLNKWRRSTEFHGDPLLFIEAIPSRETRDFVEKVMANLWIYRHRLGEPTPSLDALAAGEWPIYTPVHGDAHEVAEETGR
ncbi:MAG: lytic transglycosylase domain-containing protein [Rhodospirillales bacterium]